MLPSAPVRASSIWAFAAHAPSAPFVSRVDFHAVAVGPDGPEPPMRKMPSDAVTAVAPARASGSASVSTVFHSVMSPVAGSGVPEKTVVVGAPLASRPPMTYTVPATTTADARARGSGSGTPSTHGERLPTSARTGDV